MLLKASLQVESIIIHHAKFFNRNMIIAGHYYAHGIAYAIGSPNLETITPRLLFLQMIAFGADCICNLHPHRPVQIVADRKADREINFKKLKKQKIKGTYHFDKVPFFVLVILKLKTKIK